MLNVAFVYGESCLIPPSRGKLHSFEAMFCGTIQTIQHHNGSLWLVHSFLQRFRSCQKKKHKLNHLPCGRRTAPSLRNSSGTFTLVGTQTKPDRQIYSPIPKETTRISRAVSLFTSTLRPLESGLLNSTRQQPDLTPKSFECSATSQRRLLVGSSRVVGTCQTIPTVYMYSTFAHIFTYVSRLQNHTQPNSTKHSITRKLF